MYRGLKKLALDMQIDAEQDQRPEQDRQGRGGEAPNGA
jgi:hypothetical protein